MNYKNFLRILFILFSFCLFGQAKAQIVMPQTITLINYQLNPSLGGAIIPGAECEKESMKYGCTAYSDLYKYSPNEFPPDVYGYPFDQSTVTLDFETQYLLNVVPSEMIGTFHPSLSYEAQAIASRSYIGHKLANSVEINNSASLQTYIPNQ